MAWVQIVRQWCCRRLRCNPGSNTDRLLSHFLLQLGDEFLYAKHPSGEEPTANVEIAARVEELVKSTEPPTWERAYEVERLLVYLRPHSKLIIETDRRVAEAEGLKLPSAAKYRTQLDKVSASSAAATELAQKGAAAVAAAPEIAAGENPTQLQAVAEQARLEANRSKQQADNESRAILAAVLDDLQWFYQQRI